MKILYANGDSWTFGEELFNSGPMAESDRYYNSWPWKLTEQLGLSLCVNEAVGGGSNARIFRKTNEYIFNWLSQGKDVKDLLIVIGWTLPERTELPFINEYVDMTVNHCLLTDKEETLDLKNFRNVYYQNYDKNKGNLLQVMYMNNLRMLCANLGIRYYDFIAIGNPFEFFNDLAYSTYGVSLYKESLSNLTWKQFIIKHNYATHEHGHPTAESHHAWAEFLSKKIT